MFFANSRPDRHKRALRDNPELRPKVTSYAAIPLAKPYELLTAEEIYFGGDRTFIFDVECYPNYFLIAFKCWRTKKVVFFEDTELDTIDINLLGFILHRFLIVGFNSRNYDLPIIQVAMQGARAETLWRVTQEIIFDNMRPYEIARKYNVNPVYINHIDIIEVCPLSASLKLYAGRLHCARMQDLPYKPGTVLTPEQGWYVRGYCINDLDNTGLIYDFQKPHIELREVIGARYKEDIRSKSDAQIAEVILAGEMKKLGIDVKPPDVKPGYTFKYKVPANVSFKTPMLQRMLETVRNMDFVVDMNGYVDAAKDGMAALRLTMGACTYQMGMGGLHSTEEGMSHTASADVLLIDRDVEAFYPWIILILGLYPEHLGPDFLTAFRGIVESRVGPHGTKQKAKKLKAIEVKTPEIEALITVTMAEDGGIKITINGTFGKTGNQFSIVYSPELVPQICISGQLFLLMLIEEIELIGIPIISANTDGIVIKCPADRYDDLNLIVNLWEERTGFITEETRYSGIHCRDINNYIAVKEDGTCKTKGVYCERGSAQNSVLSKNPESQICSDAVQAFLSQGTPIAHTVENCTDIRKFVSVRTVNGGAHKDGEYLGKAIRWYYARDETGVFNRVDSGHTVPKTEGARPLMDLPQSLPDDLDFDYYTNTAIDMLYDVGFYKRPSQLAL